MLAVVGFAAGGAAGALVSWLLGWRLRAWTTLACVAGSAGLAAYQSRDGNLWDGLAGALLFPAVFFGCTKVAQFFGWLDGSQGRAIVWSVGFWVLALTGQLQWI